MTTQHLNRDIKRLYKKILTLKEQPNHDQYFEFIDGEFKKEFKRLYHADDEGKYINYYSFRAMYRMNQMHKVIQYPFFYITMKP